ncbi:MAG TPA: SRPBCC family protein [Terriglobales bacterium]|nr:SRPBCC family protein [Terriglobales bacterium]
MSQKNFWGGFGAGAGAGVLAGIGASIAWRAWRTGNQQPEVLRLEKTIQIGRPVDEVFHTWSDLPNLPDYVGLLKRVRPFGHRSHWTAEIGGRSFEWDAELVQDLRNQALGWRSISGPKHTGRISFAPIGNDTLVHVQMNYAPPFGAFGRAVLEASTRVEQYVEQALRDFKAALEGKGQEHIEQRATGTDAGRPIEAGVSTPPSGPGSMQTSRFGSQPETIEYTRPPEAKS